MTRWDFGGFLGPISSSCYEQRWNPLACIIVNYLFEKQGFCSLEILPGSLLVTQRDNEMLNEKEINSSFPFSFPHKRWVCFLLEVCLHKGCSMEPVCAVTLNLWCVRRQLMMGLKPFSDGGVWGECLQWWGGLGEAKCRGTSCTLKHWETNSSQMEQRYPDLIQLNNCASNDL